MWFNLETQFTYGSLHGALVRRKQKLMRKVKISFPNVVCRCFIVRFFFGCSWKRQDADRLKISVEMNFAALQVLVGHWHSSTILFFFFIPTLLFVHIFAQKIILIVTKSNYYILPCACLWRLYCSRFCAFSSATCSVQVESTTGIGSFNWKIISEIT